MASRRNIIRILSPDYCSAVTEDSLIRLQTSQNIGPLTILCAMGNDFMLNLAVGGNGWPVDLSRYGIIDLYADYVRVYAG